MSSFVHVSVNCRVSDVYQMSIAFFLDHIESISVSFNQAKQVAFQLCHISQISENRNLKIKPISEEWMLETHLVSSSTIYCHIASLTLLSPIFLRKCLRVNL